MQVINAPHMQVMSAALTAAAMGKVIHPLTLLPVHKDDHLVPN